MYTLLPKLPVALLNPLFALAIAGLLVYLSLHFEVVVAIVMGITLAHYYLEAHIWKGGTPHRQHFRFEG
ncbi:MAG: hypothetical protein HC848_06120 [Limnobacter sp.]|nr:hypothetical protein [Limnobacter sp.]